MQGMQRCRVRLRTLLLDQISLWLPAVIIWIDKKLSNTHPNSPRMFRGKEKRQRQVVRLSTKFNDFKNVLCFTQNRFFSYKNPFLLQILDNRILNRNIPDIFWKTLTGASPASSAASGSVKPALVPLELIDHSLDILVTMGAIIWYMFCTIAKVYKSHVTKRFAVSAFISIGRFTKKSRFWSAFSNVFPT